MENVAEALNRKWAAGKARVHFLPEYYDRGPVELRLPQELGITQIDKTPPRAAADRRSDTRNGIHDDIYYEAQIGRAWIPTLIRAEQRSKAGLFTLHGVDLARSAAPSRSAGSWPRIARRSRRRRSKRPNAASSEAVVRRA